MTHTSADDALSQLRSCLPQALEALAESPSDATATELERILGFVTEAYGRVRLARENGTYAESAGNGSGNGTGNGGEPAEFPLPVTATAVMLTVDRLLEGANLNTFELALWQHVGRYEGTSQASF